MSIHKVTDLRTGLEHPTRDRKGRFISAKRAAKEVKISSDIMEHYEAGKPGHNQHDGHVVVNGILQRVWRWPGIYAETIQFVPQ